MAPWLYIGLSNGRGSPAWGMVWQKLRHGSADQRCEQQSLDPGEESSWSPGAFLENTIGTKREMAQLCFITAGLLPLLPYNLIYNIQHFVACLIKTEFQKSVFKINVKKKKKKMTPAGLETIYNWTKTRKSTQCYPCFGTLPSLS